MADPQGQNNKYHRYTVEQIQRLQSVFVDSPHPDEKTRLQLSRELNLAPRQIKFWFQNHRTQMKVQHQRSDSSALRDDNDKIRCENIAMREALKNVICPACGGPPVLVNVQKLRMENSQLQEELDRLSSIAAKYLGVPISQLSQIQHPVPVSSTDLSMAANYHTDGSSSSTSIINPASGVGMLNISPIADVAENAMDELIRLLDSNDPLWVKSSVDGREALNLGVYDMMFPRPSSSSARLKNPNTRIESSRNSAVVIMNSLALVDMFMDVNKWVELFPNIVAKARTLEVISPGMKGSLHGKVQWMYEEQQVLSPFVPPRRLYFLRYCHQIEPTYWAIVDVSLESSPENQFATVSSPSCKTYKFPSGCLIQDIGDGYSKVTWVEHLEIQEQTGVHSLFRDLFQSGMAFGAEKWLATLDRMCQRYDCLNRGGVIPSTMKGKPSMMKLGQRLVTSFCASINPSNGHQWIPLSGMYEYDVKAMTYKCTDPGQPNGMVVSATTTIWLPIPPQIVFDFLRNEETRPQWDVLCSQNPVTEVAYCSTGTDHPGNCISVLRPVHPGQNNMAILQETCVDSSGSMVVFGPVDLPSIDLAMSGELKDPSSIDLLPSGFVISPDGCNWKTISDESGASSSAAGSSGSLLTVVLQISLGNQLAAMMTPENESTLAHLIGSTVYQIKAALNCTATASSS